MVLDIASKVTAPALMPRRLLWYEPAQWRRPASACRRLQPGCCAGLWRAALCPARVLPAVGQAPGLHEPMSETHPEPTALQTQTRRTRYRERERESL